MTMKKILPCLMLLMLVAATSHAAIAYRYADNVTTLRGDAVGGAVVTVYTANSTSAKATLYLTDSTTGQTKSNPTYTDGYGRYFFYLAPGLYDIVISGTNITTYTIEDVRIYEFTWEGNTPLPETSWDDLVVSASNIGTTAATAPAEVSWKGVLKVFSFVDAGGDFATFGAQMPHGYVGGTDVKPHFHFVCPDTILPNETVVFRLLQAQSQIGEAASDTSTIYATFTNNTAGRVGLAASALHFARIKPNVHLIAGGATIVGTEMLASSVIYARIERGPGDTHTGAVYLLSVDIHYQRDRFGTATEYE
jgi:hypothetical protein